MSGVAGVAIGSARAATCTGVQVTGGDLTSQLNGRPAGTTFRISGSYEITGNNTGGYDGGTWSCGGGKLVHANGVTFSNNFTHDNNGFGFWLDSMNANVDLVGNRVTGNRYAGFMIEINPGPISVRNNVF